MQTGSVSIYILYSDSLRQFYKGQTKDILDRINRHNQGFESYTAKGSPWRLIWQTTKETRSDAVVLESKLKNLTQARLVKFMLKYRAGIVSDDEFSFLEKLSSC